MWLHVQSCSLAEHAVEWRLPEVATDSGTGSIGLRQQAGLSYVNGTPGARASDPWEKQERLKVHLKSLCHQFEGS